MSPATTKLLPLSSGQVVGVGFDAKIALLACLSQRGSDDDEESQDGDENRPRREHLEDEEAVMLSSQISV